MVRKSHKAGLHTGNTIRLPGGQSSLHKYQNYSYFVTETQCMDKHQIKQFKEVMDFLPTADGFVEYSMNKKKRWELPPLIRTKLLKESDNDEVLMRVTEHTLHIGRAEDEHRKSCSAYYTNNGPVTEKRSHTDMNIKSAMQPYVDSDHLDRRERSEYKRRMRFSLSLVGESDEEETTPTYSCHIVRGAATNGRLYKDLSTRGALIARSSKKLNAAGCYSKLNRFQLLNEDYDVGYDIEEEEDNSTDLETAPRSRALTVQLSDCVVKDRKDVKRAKPREAGWEVVDQHGAE